MTAIRDYHERTKHSVASLQSNRHVLEWDNQPLPFKLYTELDPIPLPREVYQRWRTASRMRDS